MRERERIINAAILYGGKIYKGHRHADIMGEIWSTLPDAHFPQSIQGFLTDTGRFVSRDEASLIAFRAGQTKTQKERLLSEHLW